MTHKVVPTNDPQKYESKTSRKVIPANACWETSRPQIDQRVNPQTTHKANVNCPLWTFRRQVEDPGAENSLHSSRKKNSRDEIRRKVGKAEKTAR